MGCGNEKSKWDDNAVQDSLAGKNTGIETIPKEILEGVMPAVEVAQEQRTIECLQENVENSRKELIEGLVQNEPTDIERLDLRIEPTDKECREAFRIGREIGMEGYEIGNYPLIMGIKDPETLERIPNMRETIKEEMGYLHHSKLSPWLRDAEVVDRIMLVDKNQPSPRTGWVDRGEVLKREYFTGKDSKPELSRVVHIFRDGSGKLPEGQRLHWAVIHEMCHLNFYKGKSDERDFAGIFADAHYDEWVAACNAQIDKLGIVSPYANEQLPKEGPRESGFLNPEFIAEHVAAWDTNLVEVCPEMQAFFDKYLS